MLLKRFTKAVTVLPEDLGESLGEDLQVSASENVVHTTRVTDAVRSPVPAYHGAAVILQWSQNDRNGMGAKLQLADASRKEAHPFDEMRWGSKPGDGQRLVAEIHRALPGGGVELLYDKEVSLGFYSTDCAHGVWVLLKFDEGPDGAMGRHPFTGIYIMPKQPEIVSLTCWAIADDEMQVPPERVRRPRVAWRDKDATRQAGMKCSDPLFQEWSMTVAIDMVDFSVIQMLPDPKANPVAFTEGMVRAWCKVGSRAVLKEETSRGEEARQRWDAMMKTFGKWILERKSATQDIAGSR